MDAVFIGLPGRRIAIPARPPRPLRTFQPYLRTALRLRRSGLLPATANVIAVCRIGFRRRLRLEQFAFAARDYGSFALPGGEYTALRIELGGAQGRNWFCVLYPALCLSGAQSDYPTKAENALVFGRYEVRWAVKDAVMQIINKK